MDKGCIEENIDLSVMCRACAFPFDPAILRDITPPVRDMLFFCAGIRVDVMGALPTRLCGTCYSRADAASQFKLQCTRAEEKLLRLTQSEVGAVGTSTPNHVTQHEKSPVRISRSPLSELDVPLTPMRCDSALNIILDPRADDWIECLELQGDEERMSALTLKSLSHQPAPEEDSNIQCEPEVMNSDSILSFFNQDGDAVSRLASHADDLSFLSCSTPLKSETPKECEPDQPREMQPIDIDKFFQPFILTKMTGEEMLVDTFDKNINCKINLTEKENDIENDIQTDVNEENLKIENIDFDNIETVEVNDEIIQNSKEDFKRKDVKVLLIDFMKVNINMKEIEDKLIKYGYARCKYCTKKLNGEKSLVDHMVKKHPLQLSKVTDFVKAVAPEEKIELILKKYGVIQCKYCSVVCHSVDRFHSHLRRKHYDKCEKILVKSKVVHICDYCKRHFTAKRYLQRHIRMQHMKPKKEWKCKKCKKTFKTLTSYKSHLNVHKIKVPDNNNSMGERKNLEFMCSMCGKALSNKSNLVAHTKRHYSAPMESCTTCGKCFKLTNDLKHHMKTHEKTHKCTICKKMFSRSDNLAVHLKVHKGKRTYKCAECDECFMWNKELKKHTIDVHRNPILT